MRKRFCLILCLFCALCCCACSQQPPAALVEEAPPGERQIAAEPERDAQSEFTATLYFRFGDTALLRQETRQIALAPNETRERALVNALLEGSRAAGSQALFPEKTEALSTQAQDGVLYVTFNEALYDRYPDEGRVRAASVLRRRLAMAALAATLTESGEYRAVQVLVRAESKVGSSMRLRNSYYWLEDDGPAPLLTRQSDYLPTPAAYARALLAAWQQRDSAALGALVSQRGRAGANDALFAALASSPALIDYAVYEATASPDGLSAVACADLVLRDADGQETALPAVPLRLTNEDGVWRASAAQLAALMGETDD